MPRRLDTLREKSQLALIRAVVHKVFLRHAQESVPALRFNQLAEGPNVAHVWKMLAIKGRKILIAHQQVPAAEPILQGRHFSRLPLVMPQKGKWLAESSLHQGLTDEYVDGFIR
jgi:hypothetical protein